MSVFTQCQFNIHDNNLGEQYYETRDTRACQQKKHVDHNSFPTIKWLTQDFPPQFNINKLSFNGDQDLRVFLFHCVMVLEAGK